MNYKIIGGLLLTSSLLGSSILAQTPDTTKTESTSENVQTENTADSGKVKLKRRRKIRISRIQELQRLQKKKKGTDIFGLGLVGFTGGLSLGSLNGATKAGAASDSFSGFGMGAVFSIELAGGQMNSIGFKSSGKWYWRWGFRGQLDFLRRVDSDITTNKRVVTEIIPAGVLYYYFPMEEFKFSRKIPVLNRFHFFVGPGMMWSVGIQDTIENLTNRTFAKGPTETDTFVIGSVGWNALVMDGIYWTFDFRFGYNLTSDISDDLTGKVIEGTGGGGLLMTFHTGFAYAF